MRPTEEQVAIDSGAGKLLGVLHRPDAAIQADHPAFLFCHPFAEEKKSSHRTFVEIARRLAHDGYGVLRFDMFGCGDSEGDFGEATVGIWLDDVRAALRFMEGQFPNRQRGILGLRLGASLAAIVASGEPAVTQLVLIEPVIVGRDFFADDLRHMLIKQMMTEGSSRLSREEIMKRLERGEGNLDFDGFTVSGALYRELAALDLRTAVKTAGSVLMIQVSPRRAIGSELQELADAYRRASAQVTLRSLVMPPIWSLNDETDSSPLSDEIAVWLREGK